MNDILSRMVAIAFVVFYFGFFLALVRIFISKALRNPSPTTRKSRLVRYIRDLALSHHARGN